LVQVAPSEFGGGAEAGSAMSAGRTMEDARIIATTRELAEWAMQAL